LRVVPSALGLLWRAAPGHCVVLAVLQVVAALAAGGTLLVVRDLMRALVGDHPSTGGLTTDLALLATTMTATSVALVLQRASMTLLSERVGMFAMERVLGVACAADLADFDSPEFHGRLRRAQDAGQRPIEMTQSLLALAQSSSIAFAVLAVLFAIDPVLVAVVVVAGIPILVSSAFLSRGMFALTVAIVRNELRRRYLREVMTSRDLAKEVRVFGMARFLQRRHRDLFDERIAAVRALVRRSAGYGALGGVGTSAGLTFGAVFLVEGIRDGRLTIATAATAVAALAQVVPLVGGISANASQLLETVLFLEDYEGFCAFGDALARRDERRATQAPKLFDELVVDGVSFRYADSARLALDDVSLVIRRGETVALVGENGSGKTTLAKLLAGLYEPTYGEIRWDGANIADMSSDSLRRSLALVFQDFGRYQFSVAENIALGSASDPAGLEKVAWAANRAGADDFVRCLADGYDTVLSRELADGADLSGGQWQRIALARAFYRDAALVILDEPTAALDAFAEHELFQRARELMAGGTVLLISHRFSAVRAADRIVVMAHGRVVETGGHDELMALDGLYARMYRLQADVYACATTSGRRSG